MSSRHLLMVATSLLAVVECGGGFPSTVASDAGGDVTAPCDTTKPFNAPTPIAFSDSTGDDYMPFLSRDELTMFFSSARGDSANATQVYSTTRSNIQSAFG